ncbi:2-phospho-L-lactate guanylyltransferase [Nocardioides sp. Bht2]|uniref:2-phospho-L-lactate guanylyltransferase n=1 Tax=Nocardioides sp. Bht2 TaxID=3392297 RepID=UPI0039B63D1B
MSNPVQYVVLIPVKPPQVGKSRLGDLPDEQRVALATAFALDAISAALSAETVGQVLVVTDDYQFATAARDAGCTVMPDGVSGDLNASLTQAALESERRWPGVPVAAMCADLPALQGDDLAQALASAPSSGTAFVRDSAGTGTVLYLASEAAAFAPKYGVGSAQRHLDGGAVEITGALRTLRQDVDDAIDLAKAIALGVGPRTRAVVGLDEPS